MNLLIARQVSLISSRCTKSSVGCTATLDLSRVASYHSKKRAPKPDPPLYSKSRVKRFPMTTKRANKNYYKGNGCRVEGRITSKGRFILDPELCTELVVPDLTNFKLKPYIAHGVKKNIHERSPDILGM